jgi:hypothetical protein
LGLLFLVQTALIGYDRTLIAKIDNLLKIAQRLFTRCGRASPPPPFKVNSNSSTPIFQLRGIDGLFTIPSNFKANKTFSLFAR